MPDWVLPRSGCARVITRRPPAVRTRWCSGFRCPPNSPNLSAIVLREHPVTRIEKACVDKGLRMTDQRRVIARVLSDAADHPDAEELYRRASAIDPHISIATVYRTVKLFEDAGILERHDFRDGRSRYEE